jgi:hypothetical protein
LPEARFEQVLILKAWSPSRKRAQRLSFQPIDQPVAPSPRNSSDWRAALKNSGVAAG